MKSTDEILAHIRALAHCYSACDPDFAGERATGLYHGLSLLVQEVCHRGVDRQGLQIALYRSQLSDGPPITIGDLEPSQPPHSDGEPIGRRSLD